MRIWLKGGGRLVGDLLIHLQQPLFQDSFNGILLFSETLNRNVKQWIQGVERGFDQEWYPNLECSRSWLN